MREIGALGLAALVALLACKHAGSSCKAGTMKCADDHTALDCVDGKLSPIKCGGPKGCKYIPAGLQCDTSIGSPGDACAGENDLACSADHSAALQCKSHVFVETASCRGPKGCTIGDDKRSCDHSLALEKDPCEKDAMACSLDRRSALKCTDGRYVVAMTCKGAEACDADKGRCDNTVADVGDPCVARDIACSTDRKRLLKCEGGKFVLDERCYAGCSFKNGGGAVDFTCR